MSVGGLIALNAGMQLLQGVGESAQMRRGAQAQDENARLAETQGAYDALEALRKSRLALGEDVAALAARGGFGGSVGDLLEAKAVERQMEAANIRYSAASKARGMRQDAANMRHGAQTALFGGIMRAGAAALTGRAEMQRGARIAAAMQPMGTIPVPIGNGYADPTQVGSPSYIPPERRQRMGPWVAY
jgi:hypothetical protein